VPALTTAGKILVEDAVPRGFWDGRPLDKKGLAVLLRRVALERPEDYREVSHRLAGLGHEAAQASGGDTFDPSHLQKAQAGHRTRARVEARLRELLDDDQLPDAERNDAIVRLAAGELTRQQKEVYEESLAERNPLAHQVLSGSRGNPANLASLRGSDLLYVDHHDQPVPLPILRSYSEGLTPAEYWAGAYGARKGVIDVKTATQRAGYLGKQLAQVSHRLVVTGLDADEPAATPRGLPVATADPDNEGSLLAAQTGPYPRDTHLSARVLSHLRALGHDRILVRSPTVGGPAGGGLYARDVGLRERGVLPGTGEQVGLAAAQALSEPVSQSQLSSKHSGGVAGQAKGVSGFARINSLIQVPSVFPGGATHAQVDGTVSRIEAAPAGGSHVVVDGTRHYVPAGYELKVARGDHVEAGDSLSDGEPSPAEIVQHKGLGEGRRYFTEAFRDAMTGAGIKVHRRNAELLARGLINHVRLAAEMGEHVPDDIVPYDALEHTYTPREGTQSLTPARAVGSYMERPYLHYSIGTKVRPSVVKELGHFGVGTIDVHPAPPTFEPVMIRGAASLQSDPDWMTRMYGSGLKKSLLEAVHHGGVSDEHGTSFVPSLARAVDFGRHGLVRTPEPGWAVKKSAEGPIPGLPKVPAPAVKPLPAAAGSSPPPLPKPPAGGPLEGFGSLLNHTAGFLDTLHGSPQPPQYGAVGYDAQGHFDTHQQDALMARVHAGDRTLPLAPQAPPAAAPAAPVAASAPAVPSGEGSPLGAVSAAGAADTLTGEVSERGFNYAAGRGLRGLYNRLGVPLANRLTPPVNTLLGRAGLGVLPGAAPLLSPTGSLGLRALHVAKGSLAFGAAANISANAPAALHTLYQGARGAASGDTAGYDQAAQRTLDWQQDRARELGERNWAARAIDGGERPFSTLGALASQVPDALEAQGDLGQEALRGNRLDARLQPHQLGRAAWLQGRQARGETLTAGELRDLQAYAR